MSLTVSRNASMVGNLFSNMNSGLGSSPMNSMFSSMGTLGINYGDYASIRNGSYHKLLSSYFSSDSVKSNTASGSTGWQKPGSEEKKTYNYWSYKKAFYGSTATSKDAASKLATVESDAEKLSSAADTLLTQGNQSLFNQVTTTGKDGNKTTGYQTDAIYNAVNSYADRYNALVKSAGDSNVMVIRSSAASMKDYTAQKEQELASIGITVDAGTKLMSVDKEKFKAADMNTVKKLFQGTNSYAYQVSEKALAIDKHAQYEAAKASTYNRAGNYSYNYSQGSVWNDVI